MQRLKTLLKKRLEGARKVAVLAMGSKLRGDDAAGLLAAENLARATRRKRLQRPLKVFIGDTAPENLTGEIKKFRPTHLVILDAVDMGRRPGTAELIEPDVCRRVFRFAEAVINEHDR